MLVEAETLGVRHAPDRNQNDVGLDRFRRTAFRRLDRRLQPFSGRVDRRHFRRQLERHSLLFEQSLRLAADFAVHARQNTVEKFHHGHLRAKPSPDRAQLEPDHSGTDHKEMLRNLRQRKRAGRRHDSLFVDLDAFEARDIGAGGNDDGFRFQHLRLVIGAFDFDFPGGGDAPGAVKGVDLVLLQQEIDALHVAFDTLILEGHHGLEIEFRG